MSSGVRLYGRMRTLVRSFDCPTCGCKHNEQPSVGHYGNWWSVHPKYIDGAEKLLQRSWLSHCTGGLRGSRDLLSPLIFGNIKPRPIEAAHELDCCLIPSDSIKYSIHPLSITFILFILSPVIIGWEVQYTLDRSPVRRRSTTSNQWK